MRGPAACDFGSARSLPFVKVPEGRWRGGANLVAGLEVVGDAAVRPELQLALDLTSAVNDASGDPADALPRPRRLTWAGLRHRGRCENARALVSTLGAAFVGTDSTAS